MLKDAVNLFHPILEEQILINKPELASNFEPSSICMAPDYKDVMAEVNHLTTYRLQVLGARKIVLAKTVDVMNYLHSSNPDSGQFPNLFKVYKFMKEMTQEDAKNFMGKGYALILASSLPGDVVRVPCGWVMTEASIGKDPCVCLRRQSVAKTDLDAMEPGDPMNALIRFLAFSIECMRSCLVDILVLCFARESYITFTDSHWLAWWFNYLGDRFGLSCLFEVSL